MQLQPRYEGPPVLRIDVPIGNPALPVTRQRTRLLQVLSKLDAEQWRAPSRCDAWSVKDVAAHLVSTDAFWNLSIAAGLAGEPSRVLSSFDPVAIPAAIVDQSRAVPPEEVLDQLTSNTNALLETIGNLDAESWATLAEAPPGHLPLTAIALHALWDAWVHERDIMLPLGLEPAEEPDEVSAVLVYASALGPSYVAWRDPTRRGTLNVTASDLALHFLVDVGETVVVRAAYPSDGGAVLAGSGVDLAEAMSCRAVLPALADEDRWMLEGLREVFELDS